MQVIIIIENRFHSAYCAMVRAGVLVICDLNSAVGPIPGQFLSTEHTRKLWKSELLLPALADRVGYSEWVGGGKKTSLDYAKEKYEEIIATYNPSPLPEDKEKAIDEIMEEVRKFYKSKES